MSATLESIQGQLFPRHLIEGRRFWCASKDGDRVGFALARRHYSAWKNRKPKQRQFVGPGESVVLISPGGDALFVWRKSRHRLDSEDGVECTVFRNESTARSSDMIREADSIAWERWPGERHFTHVDPRRVRSKNPGYCFLMAGWRKTGRITTRGFDCAGGGRLTKSQAQWRYPVGHGSEDDPARVAFLARLTRRKSGGADALTTTEGAGGPTTSKANANPPFLASPSAGTQETPCNSDSGAAKVRCGHDESHGKTDREASRRNVREIPSAPRPRVLGHEFSCDEERVGSGGGVCRVAEAVGEAAGGDVGLLMARKREKQHDVSLGRGGTELDEIFVKNAFVHIERMNTTEFWIGIDAPGKPRLVIFTGVHRGQWYFNAWEDSFKEGRSWLVQRPRRAKPARGPAKEPKK